MSTHRADEKELKVCMTIVQSFKSGFGKQGIKDFLDQLKHQGASDQNFKDITYTNSTHWIIEDSESVTIIAAEVIWNADKPKG